MQNLFPLLAVEVSAFLNAADKREYLIVRSEKLFDELAAPVDLPGPDQIIDPLLRSAIRPLVGRIYDDIAAKLEAQTHVA